MIKGNGKVLIGIISVAFISLIVVFLINYKGNIGQIFKNILFNNRKGNVIRNTDKNIEHPQITEEEKVNQSIEKIINEMTLEEKIGQLFIVNLEDINNNINCESFTEVMANNISKYNIGGVVFFSNNIVDRDQVKNLINDIQSNSKIELFISVDEEGGIVTRIADNASMNTTVLENMGEVGATKNYDRAYEIGSIIGREIHELGFNLDFAPVADVITNPNNTEIGIRSFGSDPSLVAGMVEQVVKGLQENQISATLKHFPGHGGSEDNSHEQFSYTFQDLDGMRAVEFLPFIAGINQGVDFIMISHMAAPNVTGNDTPSSLSPMIITDLLRNELGYNKVVTTDALNMKAVSDYYTSEEAAIMAINAGADILLMSPDFQIAYDAVINAVNENVILEERIDESVKRILRVKIERGIIKR